MIQNASLTELVASAGSPTALKAAVETGAGTVYLGLKNATSARNFAGLNFTESDIRAGVESAYRRGRQMLFATNTSPQLGRAIEWHMTVDTVYMLGADTVTLADPGPMAYACEHHPNLRLHLSVQGSATHVDAIELMREQFGIRRAVLPRVLTLIEVEHVIQQTSVQIKVFDFGSLCVTAEGRCLLSSYATGDSPNNKGVCSPAHAVHWVECDGSLDARLNNIMIDQYVPGKPAGYPTLCKGRFLVDGEVDHVLEEPTSLNALSLLPRLLAMGVSTIKTEERQRSSTYITQVVTTLRAALDVAQADPTHSSVKPDWQAALVRHAEGAHITQSAFDRPWK